MSLTKENIKMITGLFEGTLAPIHARLDALEREVKSIGSRVDAL